MTIIKILEIALIVASIAAIAFGIWYHFEIKIPEDKRMKEEKKHATDYEKYNNEIRNF